MKDIREEVSSMDIELLVPLFQNYARLRAFGLYSYYVITIVIINPPMKIGCGRRTRNQTLIWGGLMLDI